MRLAIALLLAAYFGAACSTTVHAVKSDGLELYKDPREIVHFTLTHGDLEVRIPDTIGCTAAGQTQVGVMFKNTGEEPISIDPDEYYLETVDGEKIRHISHGTDTVTGESWWVAKLIKHQELESGASVRGLLIFSECVYAYKNTALVLDIAGGKFVYRPETRKQWVVPALAVGGAMSVGLLATLLIAL